MGEVGGAPVDGFPGEGRTSREQVGKVRPAYLGPRVWFTPSLTGPTSLQRTLLHGMIPADQRKAFEAKCETKRIARAKAGQPVTGW